MDRDGLFKPSNRFFPDDVTNGVDFYRSAYRSDRHTPISVPGRICQSWTRTEHHSRP